MFSNLLALITPPVVGIKGNVKEAVTNAVIPNLLMSAQKEGGVAQPIEVMWMVFLVSN